MRMILVTGANGNVGREVVDQLAAGGHDVRALLRSRARADILPTSAEIAIGDFADTNSLARAVDGVDAVYMTSFEHPELLRLQGNLISAARDAGVRVVARLSGMRADRESPAAISRNHALGDRQLAESGLGYVILRPNWFHQNFLGYFPGGVMRLPVGAGRTSFIDVRDIAAVAVAALTDPRHLGETFELSGPEALSHAEVAQTLSQATGRRLIFEDIAEEVWLAEAVHRGMEPSAADALIGLFRRTREGAMAEVTDAVERVTGRLAIDLVAFANDHAEALCRQL
jgi:uncharacterized protein YbjT (DUF2867 family)